METALDLDILPLNEGPDMSKEDSHVHDNSNKAAVFSVSLNKPS